MEKFLITIGAIVMITLRIFGVSLIGGTILYFIYPHINSLFLSAAKNGIIPYNLGWWDSVCIIWIFTILIKSSVLSSKKDD